MMSRVSSDAPWSEAPLLRKYAALVIAVIEQAAPSAYTAEFLRQFSLVARKIALRICGPAIITIAIGSSCARLIERCPRR